MSSSRPESDLHETVAAEAEEDAKNFEDAETSGKGTLALVELEELDRLGKIILQVVTPRKIHKEAIAQALQRANLGQILRLLELFKNCGKTQLVIFALDSIKENVYEVKSEKDSGRVIVLCPEESLRLSAQLLSTFKISHIKSFGFSIRDLVERCLEQETTDYLIPASRLIKQHGLEDEFPIRTLIEKCIKQGTADHLTLASPLIEQHGLEVEFPIRTLIEKYVEQGTARHLTPASRLIEQHGLEDEFIRTLIEKCIKQRTADHLTLASQLTEQYGLKDKLPIRALVEKCLERGTTYHLEFASSLIKKHDFNLDFIRALIKQCLVEGGYNVLSFACKLIKNYNLNNEFPVIDIMDIESGMVLSGFVNRKFEHGVFVVIKVMKEHVTAYGSEFVQAKDLSIGQEVRVRITEVDLERRIAKGALESAE